MTTKRKAPPSPTPTPVTTNGLCPKDEAALTAVLRALQTYDDRLHLLGSIERERVQFVERKLQLRLEPPPIEGLLIEARALIERYGKTLDAGRDATHQRAAEAAEEAAKRQAARAARQALLKAKIAAEERKREAMLKAMQGGSP